jgi:pimeloyl-ACP methyl ester carboxylesterase
MAKAMRSRRYGAPRRRRSRSLLWILLSLIGLGALTGIFGAIGGRRLLEDEQPEPQPGRPGRTRRPRTSSEALDELDTAPETGEEAPAIESETLWIAGPAGNLYVRDGGPGPEPDGRLPVLLLHSLAGNGGQWALQLDHLRPHRRAVALDFRGHGESDPAEDGDYSIAGFAGDVAAVADQLGLRRFVLAGHSLGASVAIEYAARHPERVAGLLLADPNGDLTRVPREQVEPFLAALREDPLGELESYYRQLVLSGDRDAASWVIEDLRLTDENAITVALESSSRYQPLPALERYAGPKLSVISDMNSLPYSLHNLATDLPARLMTGTGHWLMMDRPETFNHLLDELIEDAERRLSPQQLRPEQDS